MSEICEFWLLIKDFLEFLPAVFLRIFPEEFFNIFFLIIFANQFESLLYQISDLSRTIIDHNTHDAD